MVQINLLPDVKVEYVRLHRLRRTILGACILLCAFFLLIFLLFFLNVSVVQKNHLNHLDKDITSKTNELKSMPDIAKILTIQNQLSALSDAGSVPGLHGGKPVASRIFTYIRQLAPTEASIDTLTVDYENHTMSIVGGANNLASVNKFVDTLKFTNYTKGGDGSTDKQLAFSDVTLSQFGVGAVAAGAKTKPASYRIDLKYNADIFSSSNDTKLIIPNQVTTRSETEKPTGVFENPTPQGGNQ